MNVIMAITVMATPNVLTLQVVTRARAKQAILEMEEPVVVSSKCNYLTLKSLFASKASDLADFSVQYQYTKRDYDFY